MRRRGRDVRNVLIAAFAAAVATAFPMAGGAEIIQTDPVEVTATRIREKVSEQASSVSVVERDEIERKAPILVGDVLQGLPGVDTQRSGSLGNRENIKIRGGSATGTLVLIDGFPVNSPTLGQFDIGSLPMARFDRVEVVRGAQSALYGSNAMSGVVNFLPPRPGSGVRAGAGIAGGSYTTFQGSLFAEGSGAAGDFYLQGGGVTGQGIQTNDDVSIVSFLGGGDLRVGNRSDLHAIVMTTDAEKGIPIDFGTPGDVNHSSVRRGFLAGGRWETRISQPFTVTAWGSVYSEFNHEADPADPGEVFPFVFEDQTKTRKTDFGLMARWTAGERSTTFLGAEYTRDQATDTLTSNFGDTVTSGSTINRSVFLQEEWRPCKGTGVSAGVRVDGNTQAGTVVNPRLAVFQDLGESGVRLRAAAGRGFRTPTISEQADPFIGNPALSPEVTVTYEGGGDVLLAAGRVAFSAVWFYQSFRDLIQFDPAVSGPAGFGQLQNKGNAFSRGVESTASWQFADAAALSLSYTYSDSWDGDSQRKILGVPANRGMVSLLLAPSPRLQAQVDWYAESYMLDAPPNGGDIRRPGYSRLDFYCRYGLPADLKWITLTGKIQNLLNREYESRKGFPSPGFNFLLGAELSI